MAANYRYWCGECHYRTSWLTESAGADAQVQHYIQRHPGIEPGGRVEVRTSSGGGGGIGCLALVGVLFVVLLLAATCQDSQSSGTPAPAAHIRGYLVKTEAPTHGQTDVLDAVDAACRAL